VRWRPGELDQQINVQRETLTTDGMGGDTVALSTTHTKLWAKVMPLSGKEFERFEQLNTAGMVKFILRYVAGIRADDRIIWNDESYNIRYIQQGSARDMYLEITAEKGVAL